jgi:hypothetical protein
LEARNFLEASITGDFLEGRVISDSIHAMLENDISHPASAGQTKTSERKPARSAKAALVHISVIDSKPPSALNHHQ